MDNFDQESGQQQYANDSGLNVFQQNIWLYGLSGFRFSNQCIFDNDGFCGTYLCLYCTTPIVYGVTFALLQVHIVDKILLQHLQLRQPSL